jgi:hypothetical protein
MYSVRAQATTPGTHTTPVGYGHPGMMQPPPEKGVNKWLVAGLAAVTAAVVVTAAAFALGTGDSDDTPDVAVGTATPAPPRQTRQPTANTQDVTVGATTITIPDGFRETDEGMDDIMQGFAFGAGPVADLIDLNAIGFAYGNFQIMLVEMVAPLDSGDVDPVFAPLRLMGMVRNCETDIQAPAEVLGSGSCEVYFSDGPYDFRGIAAAFALPDRLIMVMAIHDGGSRNEATVNDVINSLYIDMSVVDMNPPPLWDPRVPQGTGDALTPERLIGSWGWDLNQSWIYEFNADGTGTAAGERITWSLNGNILSIEYPAGWDWSLMPNDWYVSMLGDEMTLTEVGGTIEYSYVRLPGLTS